MKKFVFTLDKVLTYKEQIEQNLRTEHAHIVQQVVKEEEKLRRLEDEHVACRMEYEKEKAKGSTIRQLKLHENYLESVLFKIQAAEKTIERLKIEEEAKRKEVVAAKTETSSIDRLKEKRLKEYSAAVRKEEEKFVEEFVANTTSVRVRQDSNAAYADLL